MDKENKKLIIGGLIFLLPFGVLFILDILGVNLSRNYLGDFYGILTLLGLASSVAVPIGIIFIISGLMRQIKKTKK